MKITLTEETTTLPEGAKLSVCVCRNETKKTVSKSYAELSARTDKATVTMRVAGAAPHNLPAYLTMCVAEINRHRNKLEKVPEYEIHRSLKDFAEFVHNMAANNMFILTPWQNGAK
jgi:hypothetical protein